MPKPTPAFRKYIKYVWILLFAPVLFVFLMVGLTAWGVFGELPTFEELENPKSSLASEVYSADMKTLGKYYFQNRVNIHFQDLSPNLVNALKATEDVRFEEHSGVDIKGLMRVFVKTIILQQDAGGGSTITQQLAKNLFPRENMSKLQLIIRKLKEWIIAVKLERNYTKQEILAMYLNTVEFGNNAFGIKSAATTYFGKQPLEVKIEEAALLIGLLQAPSRYNPVRNPESATFRRNTVIGQLAKYKFITVEQKDSLLKLPIKLNFRQEGHTEGLAQYFRETLRQDLLRWCKEHKKADGKPYNLYRDGLRIYTTIDTRMQRYAEEAVKEHMTDLQKSFREHWKGRVAWEDQPQIIDDAMKQSERYRTMKDTGATEADIKKAFNKKMEMKVFSWKGEVDTLLSPLDSIKYYKMFYQTGFMSMEPQTGYVRAWVGGNDYKYFQYDHVKDGKRQVGSTFKPFLYTLAMQEGYSPCYEVPNVPVTIVDEAGVPWTPSNSDGKYGGMLSLKEALAESVNCISAYLMKQFGAEAVVQVARKMGITSPIDPFPSIALGTADVSVFEMVAAYCTFANKGVYTEPQYILRIEDKNGVVLQDFVPRKIEAISEETAYLMLDLMKGVTLGGTGARLRGSKYGFTNPIAGKTGTTQNNSDGWFMGITPDLVSGAWAGCEDRAVHFRTTQLGQGANTALPTWGLFMKKVYADPTLNYSKGDFERPEKPIGVELDCKKYKNPAQQQNGGDDFGI
ncbi:MAG: PBP1A family penicillin-binding protein [Bacteroidetes bacterium]|nr:PBP1A family penicillin-binding protein [Bacteroidota bacterium]